MKGRFLELILLIVFIIVGPARSQTVAANPVRSEAVEDELAREVDDPTAILAQLKFQDLYTPQNFGTTAQTNELQLKMVFPLQAISFFPFQQIMRPTFRFKTLATSAGASTTSQFGDMELFDLFVSNW